MATTMPGRYWLAAGALAAVTLGASFPRPVLNQPDEPVWKSRYGQSSANIAAYRFVDSGPVEALPGPLWTLHHGGPPPVFAAQWPQDLPPDPGAAPRLPDVPTARELVAEQVQETPEPKSGEEPAPADRPDEPGGAMAVAAPPAEPAT